MQLYTYLRHIIYHNYNSAFCFTENNKINKVNNKLMQCQTDRTILINITYVVR